MAFTGNGGGGGGGGETSPARLEAPVSLPGGLLPSRRACLAGKRRGRTSLLDANLPF